MNVLLVLLLTLLPCSSINAQTKKIDQSMFLENEKNSISVFQNYAESIVNVTNLKKVKRFFDISSTEVQAGLGSGIVWDKSGYIVTNSHVIDQGDSFAITFKDDPKQYRAKLIGADPKKDLAVLKLNELPKTLKPIPLGDSKALLVGQKALAIGNPLGLDHTLTTGTVSALNRKIVGFGGVSINGMIQTDASINPGNSGGALLDSQGKLIGINTMIFNGGGSSSSAGLGFAIPVDTVKNIIPQLIKFGKVIRPGLGIVILEDMYAMRLGIKEGVVIRYVDPKGPAGKAGLKGLSQNRYGEIFLGDIVVAINNSNIKTFDDLFTILDSLKIGEKVKIKYLRDDKERIAEIVLSQI